MRAVAVEAGLRERRPLLKELEEATTLMSTFAHRGPASGRWAYGSCASTAGVGGRPGDKIALFGLTSYPCGGEVRIGVERTTPKAAKQRLRQRGDPAYQVVG